MRIPASILTGPNGSNVTIFVPGGDVKAIPGDHPNFKAIVGVLTEAMGEDGVPDVDDVDSLIDLFDIEKAVATKFQRLSDRVTVENGVIYFDGDEVRSTLADQVLRFLEEGEDFGPLLAFWDKIAELKSTSLNSYNQLYDWVSAREGVTITEDGDIVGYKGVASDGNGGYCSIHSGTAFVNDVKTTGRIPNKVGDTITMPRSAVMDDPYAACHQGLHVGTYEYAQSYSSNGVMLRVRVNPRDVVSVPYDARGEKIRVCKYVVEEIVEAKYEGGLYHGVEDDGLEDDDFDVFSGLEKGDDVRDPDGDVGTIESFDYETGEVKVRFSQFGNVLLDLDPDDLELLD